MRIRRARPEDVPTQSALSLAVFGKRGAWTVLELSHHHGTFPEGQLVAEDSGGTTLLGMAVSLVVDSGRWAPTAPWAEVTGQGRLTTHDPSGDILYGAGLAVHPRARGHGVARALYRERERLLEDLSANRIRVGARIPGYARVAHRMTAEAYVDEVLREERTDPTLSFQLHMGFGFVALAAGYLPLDVESRGYAAIVEWPGDAASPR